MQLSTAFLLLLLFAIGIHAIDEAKWSVAKEKSPEMHDVLKESEGIHVEQMDLFLSLLVQTPDKGIPELVDLAKGHRKKARNEKLLLELLLNNAGEEEEDE